MKCNFLLYIYLVFTLNISRNSEWMASELKVTNKKNEIELVNTIKSENILTDANVKNLPIIPVIDKQSQHR